MLKLTKEGLTEPEPCCEPGGSTGKLTGRLWLWKLVPKNVNGCCCLGGCSLGGILVWDWPSWVWALKKVFGGGWGRGSEGAGRKTEGGGGLLDS